MKTAKMKDYDIRTAAVFLAPSLAGFLLFYLLPFLLGFSYSLVDSPVNSRFAGLDNYIELLRNPVFLKAASNTVLFTVISVPLNMLVSFGLALLLNRKLMFRSFFRTVFLTPLVIPVASMVLVWQILFHARGVLNGLLAAFGALPPDWMKTDWARWVILVVYLWKNSGYNMILYLAALQEIPKQYYEAADVDGAGKLAKLTHITLVYLVPSMIFILLISIINSFKVFREIYLVAGPYPHDSIYMLQHYMNNMFFSLDYQKLTSAAFIMAVSVFLLVKGLFSIEHRMKNFIG